MVVTTEMQVKPVEGFDWWSAEQQFNHESHLAQDAALLGQHVLKLGHNNDAGWISADALPNVHALRKSCDEDSHQILANRQELLRDGEFEQVPYAFDTLTTAKKLLQAEKDHGKTSLEYTQVYKGFYLDSKRHRDEARRRLTWEYFPEVEQQFDDERDSYVYGAYALKDIVDNGLSPVGAEEVGVDTLIANRREEYTHVAIGKLGQLMLQQTIEIPLEQTMTTMTVSQLDNSPQTMVWGVRYDPLNGRRFQEQVGFTKEFITHDVIVEAYKQKGVIAADSQPTKQDILSTQAINMNGEGVLDFMALLDTIASEKTGRNIFMGEAVAADFHKDYQTVPAEAATRQAENQEEVEDLMNEVLRLAKTQTDSWLANRLVDDFVTEMLVDRVATDPGMANQIFGQSSAREVERSLWHRAQGDFEKADRIIADLRTNAPRATVCSGGSCGVETINANSSEGLALASEAKAQPGDKIAKDKIRSCKCGGEIVYAYNDKKVNKKCLGRCGAFESKISIVSKTT